MIVAARTSSGRVWLTVANTRQAAVASVSLRDSPTPVINCAWCGARAICWVIVSCTPRSVSGVNPTPSASA